MHISKITIGRLFNLGNYEHIRYELTVDVQPGEATAALRGTENLLRALNPKRPSGVATDSELAQAKSKIELIRSMTDEAVRRNYGMSKYGCIRKFTADLADAVSKTEHWNARQHAARKRFDDLGGASQYRDAKLDWQDFDEDYYE